MDAHLDFSNDQRRAVCARLEAQRPDQRLDAFASSLIGTCLHRGDVEHSALTGVELHAEAVVLVDVG